MKATEMHVISQIIARLGELKLTRQALADIMCKDITTIKKQLTETRGNLSLLTVYDYAEALGGCITFLTDEELADLQNVALLRAQLAEASKNAETQGLLAQENAALKAKIEKLEAKIEKLETRIDIKEDAISRKDRIIHELAKKAGMF